jgi:hypothetical protein
MNAAVAALLSPISHRPNSPGQQPPSVYNHGYAPSGEQAMRYFKARLHEMNLNWGVLRLWLAISGIWMILVMGITSYGSAAPISYLKFYRPLSVTIAAMYFISTSPSGNPH